MGREIRRVPLDFDAEIDETWPPLLMPDGLVPLPCPHCRYGRSEWPGHTPDASGLTREAWAIEQTFYPHQIGGPNAEALAWHDKIGQREVDYLIAEGRLPAGCSAAVVNAAQSRGGFGGHDAISRGKLVRFRCEQLGIPLCCPACEGDGFAWRDEAHKAASEAWEPAEVPVGDGWQVWQTVSEGGPVTPVLPTPEALIDYLVSNGDAWDQARGDGGWRRDAAESFVRSGWAPTLMADSARGVMVGGRDADRMDSSAL